MEMQGFSTIYNIAGGIHAYAVKADPTIPTYWALNLFPVPS